MEVKKPEEKEVKVIQMLADDLNHAEIAVALGCSVRTIENTTQKIRAVWGLKSLSAICVKFYKEGWIQ